MGIVATKSGWHLRGEGPFETVLENVEFFENYGGFRKGEKFAEITLTEFRERMARVSLIGNIIRIDDATHIDEEILDCVQYQNVEFLINFGPFTKGETVRLIAFDFIEGTIKEYGMETNQVTRECRFVIAPTT